MRLFDLRRLFLPLIFAQSFTITCIAHPVQNLNALSLLSSHLLARRHNDASGAFNPALQNRAADDFMSHLGFGWAQNFQEFNSWLPAQTATSILESFYRGILYNAQNVWPVAIAGNTLLVKQGALTFRLHCDKKTIPWTMVKDIARVLLDATELGFTGRYEGKFVYLGPGTTIATVTTIYVSLRINHLMIR